MAIAGLPHPVKKPAHEPQHHPRPPRWLVVIGCVVLAGVMVGIWFAGKYWPYRYREVKPLLEDVFGSQVAIAHYHRTYFPNPGFIATGLTLRRKSAPDQPPIGTVQTLFVQGHWIDLILFRRRVELVDMTAVHMVLPPPGSRAAQEDFPAGSTADFGGPDTPIARLEIHDSVLDILRTGGGRFSFPVRLLHIENMRKGRALTYSVDMDNAIPHGRIRASGYFGPLNANSPGNTPLEGQFVFNQINLNEVGELHGTMASSGKFSGRLDTIHASAQTQTPDFAVKDGQSTPISGSIDCTINGLNGDVVYHSMEARSGDTLVHAAGSTTGNSGKSTSLDISVTRGRAQDILRPFLHRDVPIAGPVGLHAHTYLSPTRQGGSFLERLRVEGGFDIPAERITNRSTEKSLSAFSERANGGKAPNPDKEPSYPVPDAISSLAGPATIRNAIVTTHDLTFTVAGAQASLDGTFNLHTRAVHLTGKLATHADLSHDATGFKSFLLKPLAPFFRRKKAGAVIPIAVTGQPGHYKVTQNIMHTK
ncbi:MAG TPA: hypothetical protein VG225_10005 [Terracidiphilus sp.]|jgi:hypothetical protein|nr:hypothetical protein [Terracidiphilus sp.]